MKTVRFHFDDGLRPLLPAGKQSGDFDYTFNGPQSAKHLIESVGIPHTEIGDVLANGQSAGPAYLVKDGDLVEVLAVSPPAEQVSEPRFVLDGHLGRLAAHLRMLGLDSLYRNDYDDLTLGAVSEAEGRILLTRDRRLLMRKQVTQGYLLRSLEPLVQLSEVVRRYTLRPWVKPFERCIRCNHLLEPVSKEAIIDRLEPLTKRYFDEFHLCPACEQIYWKGSHFEKMERLIATLDQDTSML